MKIKKGDTVLVTRGKSRGKTGKILRVFPQLRYVVVEGANVHVKHTRARRAGQKGQRVQLPTPLPAANVKVVCAKCAKPTRVGYRTQDKKRVRVCKKCGADIQ